MRAKPKGAKYRNLNRHGGVIYYDRTVKGRRISFSTRTSDWNAAVAGSGARKRDYQWQLTSGWRNWNSTIC